MMFEWAGHAETQRRLRAARTWRLHIARCIGTYADERLRTIAQFDGPFEARMAQHELDRREGLER